jgi:MOSC domain-containing protein YiiM
MRGFGDCTPCEIPAEIAKKPKRFAQVFKGAGGLRAEILSDGYLYEGDVIRW